VTTPLVGKIPRVDANRIKSMIPSQNSGIEYKMSDIPRDPTSKADPRRQAP
jgi:hypothetical protein